MRSIGPCDARPRRAYVARARALGAAIAFRKKSSGASVREGRDEGDADRFGDASLGRSRAWPLWLEPFALPLARPFVADTSPVAELCAAVRAPRRGRDDLFATR